MNKLELLRESLVYSGLAELPSDALMLEELNSAAILINHRRNYTPTGFEDVPKEYDSLHVKLAIAAIRKTGAEGQNSHSENGVSRSYMTDGTYPRDLLRLIPWAVR